MMNLQSKTPLYDKLISHNHSNPISFHVPGHKNGAIFHEKGVSTYSNLLKLDVTELSGLDDLHSPEGVILEAKQLLASLYQVERSYFLVNGSTVGNLVMILAAVNEGDIVLVQRNCHKSILNGLQLSGAKPVFISPEFNENWHVAAGPTVASIRLALELYPDAKALIVTYPNYYGMVYNLGDMIELAHRNNIPILVDEAHGAHFIAGEPFPASAVSLGADMVVQSAHKTLPALTMSSFLHYNSQLISQKKVEKYLHILQSSSPSYPLMASLDLARSYLGTLTLRDRQYLNEQIQRFREGLGQLPGIRVLTYENDAGDLLKITIQSTVGLSGFALQEIFEQAGMFAELADPINLLLIVPLLKDGMEFPFAEVLNMLNRLLAEQEQQVVNVTEEYPAFYKKEISLLELSFAEMDKRECTQICFDQAIGKICAEMIIPYPPGVPLLFPGEMITEGDMAQILWHINKGTRFQGGELLKKGYIMVF
ncbi:aminotransferase class I/II-fold pyridoxal phosphate-dependent enzyme [Bacillus sp. DNRA2]|uniref:aminotransferase class I/II-fold pyridoxal phosphate-dependent enzyme n=1 Tax=Bacillus sp. DNRA2 TaxID=2723053 RepID=UPI0032B746C0